MISLFRFLLQLAPRGGAILAILASIFCPDSRPILPPLRPPSQPEPAPSPELFPKAMQTYHLQPIRHPGTNLKRTCRPLILNTNRT
jgi:hypothetical protein